MLRLGRMIIRKGFLGGSTGWSLLGVVFFAPKVWRALFGRKQESVTVGPLAAGEGLTVRAVRRR